MFYDPTSSDSDSYWTCSTNILTIIIITNNNYGLHSLIIIYNFLFIFKFQYYFYNNKCKEKIIILCKINNYNIAIIYNVINKHIFIIAKTVLYYKIIDI